MHTKKPSFPIVRMYSTIDRNFLEKEIKRQVLEYRYKIGKSTIYDDQDRTEGDIYDAEIMQSAMNTLAIKERETATESKKAQKKKKGGVYSQDGDDDVFLKMFELHESRNQHKSYLTRKSSSVRGALITNDGEIGLESKATSASQKATIINQQIENDMSEYGHMRIKIPIINNFE